MALAINAFRLSVPRVRAQVQASAYTVILAETIVDAQGGTHPGALLTSAVRSDGSEVIRSGSEGASAREIRMASGRKIQVSDKYRMKSTISAPAINVTSLPDPASKCMKSFGGQPLKPASAQVVGEETIAGYQAVKIKNGSETSWYALAHGCAIVQSRIDFGGKQASDKRLVAFMSGEPDPALFAVPADYVEGPPSARRPPTDAKCDAPCQASQNRWFAHLDEDYYKHRVQ